LPEISLPDRKYRNGHFIGIQVWGESMLNTLVGGDWIICQFVENQSYINFGEIYVVVTENRSPVIKRIERDEDPECFQLVSDNLSHKPYSVLKSEIIEVWRYDSLIRWQPFTLKKID
jgi:SOS-response transcriptional repressor LexA